MRSSVSKRQKSSAKNAPKRAQSQSKRRKLSQTSENPLQADKNASKDPDPPKSLPNPHSSETKDHTDTSLTPHINHSIPQRSEMPAQVVGQHELSLNSDSEAYFAALEVRKQEITKRLKKIRYGKSDYIQTAENESLSWEECLQAPVKTPPQSTRNLTPIAFNSVSTLRRKRVAVYENQRLESGQYHRDYLLQEMEWMAADFAQERKWKHKTARHQGTCLVSFHRKRKSLLMRKEKLEMDAQRRVCARLAREIKKFWVKIDKIIQHKAKLEANQVRKMAMDRQLKQLVHQTERYASDLAATFLESEEKEPELDVSDASIQSEEEDDETDLIEEEERLNWKEQAVEETEALQAESEMSIEELMAKYQLVSKEKSSDTKIQSRRNRKHTTDPLIPSQSLMKSTRNPQATLQFETRWAGQSLYRPFLLTRRLELRAYQVSGVAWLIRMCEKRINGILADEMGLGKTIQTISLLAYLACFHYLWGPHLIIVPTSCLVNWEMEIKRWCPAFKVLTYFGSAKRRKALRQGWSKQNTFHICITSYQLIVQDAHCFKRKKWYYVILDEAHHIKNWKSLRWQTLLTLNAQRRLLLTGTPLQNHIMELWALMHFLMPHLFSSRKEFLYWFQQPLNQIVEHSSSTPLTDSASGYSVIPQDFSVSKTEEGQSTLVSQLHGIIRPFVLRRLKKDVAKQLPRKVECVIVCALSKRQRALYEDFLSRSSTRQAMSGWNARSGNFMSLMNILMQLRKVCNHPDLFEPRPIASPFDMPSIVLTIPTRCHCIAQKKAYLLPYSFNLVEKELESQEFRLWQRQQSLFMDDVSIQDEADISLKDFAFGPDVWEYYQKTQSRKKQNLFNTRRSHRLLRLLRHRLDGPPLYGDDCIRAITLPFLISAAMTVHLARKEHRPRDLFTPQTFQHWRWLGDSSLWNNLVLHPHKRIANLTETVAKRVICVVPKARARSLELVFTGKADGFSLMRERHSQKEKDKNVSALIAQRIVAPYDIVFQQTQLQFPNKKLLQFDCGKLQKLDTLLRRLRRHQHRCLIFTQMTSMLNILEQFLNLHGHTYFRLDGSTPVEKRQMLMEKFNQDASIFCFILSTRSGGLGINLTGADTVIFYDSDWNPAMDAQAQDRAHRIGQTRKVHIYRLISEHTVEENILKKAQQKRHLEALVMTKGQFTVEFFSTASLRELVCGQMEQPMMEKDTMTADEIEMVMAELEDEDDVLAMKGAKKEVITEEQEFQDEGQSRNSGEEESLSDVSDTERHEKNVNVRSQKTTPRKQAAIAVLDDEREEEETLKAWKASVSSLETLQASLSRVNQYALRFREQMEYEHAFVPTLEMVEKELHAQAMERQWNVDQMEMEKAVEERTLIEDGELIAGLPYTSHTPHNAQRYFEFYKQKRSQIHFLRRKRQLTGAAWQILKCKETQCPFYYNTDTKEAVWDRPAILIQMEQYKHAQKYRFAGLSTRILLWIVQFLEPFPDRICHFQLVCRAWQCAALDTQLYRRISALNTQDQADTTWMRCIEEAKKGECIFFTSGIYRIDRVLTVKTPIQMLADFDTHVELHMATSKAHIRWEAKGGKMKGFSITRRPDFSMRSKRLTEDESSEKGELDAIKVDRDHVWQHLLKIVSGGRLHVSYCDFDGRNCGNACISLCQGLRSFPSSADDIPSVDTLLCLQQNRIYSAGSAGIVMSNPNARLVVRSNSIFQNRTAGIVIMAGNAIVKRNKFADNGRYGIRLFYHANHVIIEDNIFRNHMCKSLDVENSGRRFVVRWNEGIYRENGSNLERNPLPHDHGTLKLHTWCVEPPKKDDKLSASELPRPLLDKKLLTSQSSAPYGISHMFKYQDLCPPMHATRPNYPSPFASSMMMHTLLKSRISPQTNHMAAALFPSTGRPFPLASSQNLVSAHLTNANRQLSWLSPPERKRKWNAMEPMNPSNAKYVRQILTLRDRCEKEPEKIKRPRKSKEEKKSPSKDQETTAAMDSVKDICIATDQISVVEETKILDSEHNSKQNGKADTSLTLTPAV